MDWTQEEVEQIKAAYLSGLSIPQIAVQIGRSEKSVRNKLARINISVKDMKKRVPFEAHNDYRIACPFFLEIGKSRSIMCEGIISKTVTLRKFTDEKEFANYVASFCASDYKLCPIAIKLFEKWE